MMWREKFVTWDHCSTSLGKPHTSMKDTYNLTHGLRQLTRDVKCDVRTLSFGRDVTCALPRKTPNYVYRTLCDVKCHK